ncbi:MAG TPA: metal-dependent hydrolase [Longimicrobiales bacterium]|nr:metal-dependent hydrolase [Longimicrobiales bacterium]
MFLGHIGVALAAKRVAPAASAGALVAAAMLIDLVWPLLLLLGIERVEIVPGLTAVNPLRFTHYPVTHSLLAVLGWALLAGALYLALRRLRRAALVVGALVASHWVLDLLTHIPDLPLWPGSSPRLGLGLWNSLPATIALEGSIFAAGIGLYLHATRATDRTGSIAFWSFAALLVAIYAATLAGPPPPDTRTIAYSALTLWILPFWAHWFDRHRAPSGLSPQAATAQNVPA